MTDPKFATMKEKKVRQLSAIMFSDIVGYTALMQGDEELASKARARHREVFEQQHSLHQGEIIQYYGDGALSVFKSAIEAASCAIQIQKLLQEEVPVPIRIGLHMGDIVFDGTEIYGDGVNIASRIENLGMAGAILVSGKLNDELKNHHTISTTSMGFFDLKNVAAPVEIFAISNQGIIVPQPSELKGNSKMMAKTIAVLPFMNMSASQENEYFSDGITEEIINALAKIKSLKVTSRTSSFYFKNKNIPIREIGKQLSVSAILEGSVRLAANTIRITAQLIQAEEDFHFWSETWDRKLENIFEIQDEISLIIADKLREQFGHFDIQDHLVEKQTNNITAYEYSLKAKFFANKWNPEDMKTAIGLYQKALELDPKHAESVLGLADCYSFLATTGFMPAEEGWGKTAELTQKALKLNGQLPGIHYQLSNIAFFTGCDYAEAFKEMSKAIEIKPNYVDAQQFMSFLYIIAGEKEKSYQHLEIALSIDPLSQETLFFSAYYDYMLGDYHSALGKLDRCLEHNPKNIPAHSVKCYCLLQMGNYDEVLGYFDLLPPNTLAQGDKLGLSGIAYALKNDQEHTKKHLAQLLEHTQTPDGFRANSYLFLMYAVLGDMDKAFEWIKKTIENKLSLILFLIADPLAHLIKEDPRYEEYHQMLFPKHILNTQGKMKKNMLDGKAVSTYTRKLLEHVKKEEPYLDPNLSLRSLAGQVNIHPNQLSWLLNESVGKNFNEFVNHYRVETFKKISKNPKYGHLTLLGMAYESGFNSKLFLTLTLKKKQGPHPANI